MNQHNLNQLNNTSTSNQNASFSKASRTGRRWLLGGIAAITLGVLTLTGVSFANDGLEMQHGRHFGLGAGGRMHAMPTPEQIDRHIGTAVDHILSDGTAAQKAALGAVVKAAVADLQPLHLQHQASRKQAVQLLTSASIDHAAMEQLRLGEMQLADQASRRIMMALEEAAEVLTPEQRLKLAEHLQKRFG